MKLLKCIAAEPPPLTSGTSQSRIAIIGTVVGFLILVVIGLLFGIIAVMYLIIVPHLSANRAHIATNKLLCYRRSITLATTSTPAIPISRSLFMHAVLEFNSIDKNEIVKIYCS
jgi:hypothetical protein